MSISTRFQKKKKNHLQKLVKLKASKTLHVSVFYKLECKHPQMSEAENDLCAQYAQFKTNTTEKGKKKV